MRAVLVIIISVYFLCPVLGQDSTAQENRGVISSIRKKLHGDPVKPTQSSDSVKGSISQKIDTLKLPVADSVGRIQKIDSLQRYNTGIKKTVSAGTDSIKTSISEPFTRVGAKAGQAQSLLDSVYQKANRPIENVNKKIGSADQTLQQKVAEGQAKADEKLNKVEGRVQGGVSKATDGEIKIADQSFPGSPAVTLPSVEEKLPSVAVGGTEVSIPAVEIPSTDLPQVTQEGIKLPDEKLNVDALKDKTDISIPGADAVKDAGGKIDNADSQLAVAEKYEQELQQVKNGDLSQAEHLSKKAEEKVADLDEVKAATGETTKLTKQQAEYEALIQRYRDKKVLQEEIVRKAKNVANDKVSQHSAAFKDAQEKLAKAKKLNPDVKSFRNLEKKRYNEMRDRPFYERLVPGITLQVYNTDVFTIDWGAQLAFRISGRFSLGAGGVYRTNISENYTHWVRGGEVYGSRTFANFIVAKGFYTHAEFEALRASQYVNPLINTDRMQARVRSAYVGIGKRYDISRKVKGSALVLYRIELKGDRPAVNKLNVRIGFDYNMKKRKSRGKQD